jgi:DNA-binding transcriptional ArsR family regulator
MSADSSPLSSEAVAELLRPSAAPAFFAALGNPLRWQMVKLLRDGGAMSASQMAKLLSRDFDGVSKHLRVLRQAGVVRSQPGEDRRVEMFYIAEENRPQPGVLQWGTVRLDQTA